MLRGALVWATAFAAVAALTGCDDQADDRADAEGPTSHRAADQPSVEDGLLVTRSPDDVFEIHDGAVDCVPSPEGADDDVVRLVMPASAATLQPQRLRNREPFFYVEVRPGATGWFELPLEGVEPDVVVFGFDAEDRNELSASLEGATGSVTVLEATCDPEPALAFTIRATLDSEVGLPSVTLVGGFEAGGES